MCWDTRRMSGEPGGPGARGRSARPSGPGGWGPPGGTGAGSSLPPLTAMVPLSVGRVGGKSMRGTGRSAGQAQTVGSHSAICRNHSPAD